MMVAATVQIRALAGAKAPFYFLKIINPLRS